MKRSVRNKPRTYQEGNKNVQENKKQIENPSSPELGITAPQQAQEHPFHKAINKELVEPIW